MGFITNKCTEEHLANLSRELATRVYPTVSDDDSNDSNAVVIILLVVALTALVVTLTAFIVKCIVKKRSNRLGINVANTPGYDSEPAVHPKITDPQEFTTTQVIMQDDNSFVSQQAQGEKKMAAEEKPISN